MKKILFIIAAFAAVACSEGAGNSYLPVRPYTLSVDRYEIKSDGKQAATFIITDAEGKVLTDDSELLAEIYFKNEATGTRLNRRTKIFKSVEDGEFTFSATVSGDECENKVTIKSSGRSEIEVFRKNVALYRMTATWCSNCPSMTAALEKVNEWTKDRIVELGLHGAGSDFALSIAGTSVADHLNDRFKTEGFPSCVYDMDQKFGTRVYTEIQNLIFDRIAEFPTSCGIKASSVYADGEVTITANVKSSTGGKYDVGYALLRDNCIPGDSAYEDVYDNVVLALSGNYELMSQDAFNLQKDAESESVTKSVTVDIPADDMANYSTVVFVLKQDGNDIYTDNVVKFPLGESVDYQYN